MSNSVVIAVDSPTFSFIGLNFQFLATSEQTKGDLCLMRNVMAPGLAVPFHSHPDPEVFHVIEGSMEVYQDGCGWLTVNAGEVLALEGHIKHALRNSQRCVCMTATGNKLISFFQDASVPIEQGAEAIPAQLQRIAKEAAAGHIWLATVEENAAIGIHLSQ
jgi:quercetin dioxygenase-like cupin family protein